jgi:ribosomal protein L37AE/L43A
MSKPKCPNCGTTETVVKTGDGNYGCQECGDFFDPKGNKLKK